MRGKHIHSLLTSFLAILIAFTFVNADVRAHNTSTRHTHSSAPLKCKSSRPSVSIKTSTTRTKYIRTKSAKDLTEMHGGAGATVGGLGGGEIGFKTQGEFETIGSGSRACVRLKHLQVTFFAKPEIHIASNFNRSTCEYNAVMAHEKGHIRILRKFVREYSPMVKLEIQRIAKRIKSSHGPIPASGVAAAQNKIQKQFMSEIEKYNAQIMLILAKRQKAFDSPQEYTRVASKCRKWDKKLSSN